MTLVYGEMAHNQAPHIISQVDPHKMRLEPSVHCEYETYFHVISAFPSVVAAGDSAKS